MSKVLIINASPRTDRSISRRLSKHFVESWINKQPTAQIIYRELGKGDIPHVTEAWIAGAFKPAHLRSEEDLEALKISDTLIKELKEADVVVVATPMYNWSVPSSLKAYIDQVIRVNETIQITGIPADPYRGLLQNKSVYLLISRGNSGYSKGEFNAHLNFQSDYLKTVFHIMGIDDVQELLFEGIEFDRDTVETRLEAIRKTLDHLITPVR